MSIKIKKTPECRLRKQLAFTIEDSARKLATCLASVDEWDHALHGTITRLTEALQAERAWLVSYLPVEETEIEIPINEVQDRIDRITAALDGGE